MDVELFTVICMKEGHYLWWLEALRMGMERTRVNTWTSLYQDLNGNSAVSFADLFMYGVFIECSKNHLFFYFWIPFLDIALMT